MVTEEMARSIIKKYAPILHLDHWIITVEISPQEPLQELMKVNDLALGVAYVNDVTRIANIYIWEYADTNTLNVSLETIVVHEMVHIMVQPLKKIYLIIVNELEGVVKELMLRSWNEVEEVLVNQITRIVLENTNTRYLADKDYLMTQVVATILNQHVKEILEVHSEKKTPKKEKNSPSG